MECPHEYQPKLDVNGRFWKGVRLDCLQAFSQVHWHPGKSQWFSSTCKLHAFQSVLRKALSKEEGNLELTEIMKRGPEEGQDVLYAFTIDPALKYQLTPGERDFLKKLNLEDFISSNSWGVLHSQLVTEAIAALEPATFSTTLKGEKVQLIAQDWREQFKHTFQLTKKEAQPVTRKWELTELFPTLRESPEKETVRISDCQHPGARRPLRLLSSIFCLNPTHQNQITLAFVEMVVAALNGQEADWPQEFYHELTEELTTLHSKHSATRVKVEKTSIGPHLTLILKAGGFLNIREELEAGYRSEKALTLEEQLPNPKKSRSKEVKGLPETQTTFRLKSTPQKAADTTADSKEAAPVYSVTVQPAAISPETPKNQVILETMETRQIPNALPAMVEQICQAHRRLENLLFSFTSKAPQGLMSRMNNEFCKVQREASLQESLGQPTDPCTEVLLKFQEVQLKHLTQELSNSDSLNDLNIEAIFHLEEKLATLKQKLYLTEEEVLSLTAQKGEALGRLQGLQDKMDTQTQQMASRDQEIRDLRNHITDMEGMLQRSDRLVANQKETILRLQSQIATESRETEPHRARSASDNDNHPTHPIMSRERHTLAAGIANRLLNELRRELAHTQEEKADLLKTIIADSKEFAPGSLPQSAKWTGTEFCSHMLQHIAPLNSIMQYHRVCGGLHLLFSNLPVLKTGCHLEFSQIEAMWNQADAAAKDTLAFMWCLNELKLPVGVMETISGSPPFYIKRYVLRCLKWLSQHRTMTPAPREIFPALRSYSHGQYYSVRDYQRSKLTCFDQALATLATADTAICYEAVQHYQVLANQHPYVTLQPSVSQIKSFVTKTLEEQDNTLTSRRFGTINSSTLLLLPKDQMTEYRSGKESIGTCFL